MITLPSRTFGGLKNRLSCGGSYTDLWLAAGRFEQIRDFPKYQIFDHRVIVTVLNRFSDQPMVDAMVLVRLPNEQQSDSMAVQLQATNQNTLSGTNLSVLS
jgi:hypothetical protein